ncbi:MAG: pyrimidine 5'-nucleotidase [Chloroflexi bacterium]|nr:pyrimidine 5'-nucleotidase [Chloroflexota bacterium]
MIQHLLLDLDETLYTPDTGVMHAIRDRIRSFMIQEVGIAEAEVDQVRRRFNREYGTSLRGLQAECEIDTPYFLRYVHDVPVEKLLKPSPALRQMLETLPMHKHIFTNAYTDYVVRVLNALDITEYFDNIFDVISFEYRSKPDPYAYELVLQVLQCTAAACLVADDSPPNVRTAKMMGMIPVLVGPLPQEAQEFQYVIPDILHLPDILTTLEQTYKGDSLR